MFVAEHLITPHYQTNFKPLVEDLISLYVMQSIFQQYDNIPNLGQKITELPKFMELHFQNVMFRYLQNLLDAFKEKYQQQGEQDWINFLKEYMPKYKKSSKRIAERKMPFPKIEKEFLNIALKYL